MILDELISLDSCFSKNGLQGTLLKGFALMGEIYKNEGERFASDVDLLVRSEDLENIHCLLLNKGFTPVEEKKWKGNDFKKVYLSNKVELPMTLELHTRLFWHVNPKLDPFEAHGKYCHFNVLSKEDQLLHLCGHLAFQHNFIKLFWLIDIQKFIETFDSHLDWPRFWEKASEWRLKESAQICLFLAGHGNRIEANISRRQVLLRKLCDSFFLIHPRSSSSAYFFIKFLTKDRSLDGFKYLFHWTLSKVSISKRVNPSAPAS